MRSRRKNTTTNITSVLLDHGRTEELPRYFGPPSRKSHVVSGATTLLGSVMGGSL